MARRSLAFAVLAAGCILVAGLAVTLAMLGRQDKVDATASERAKAGPIPRPSILFRTLDHSQGPARFGVPAIAQPADPGHARRVAGLQCARLHAAATGALCVARAGSLTGAYKVEILGPDLTVRHRIGLAGTPSRARVSPDGRYGATTMFVSGHSYARAGTFSTQTMLIDMGRGKRIADLESFEVTRGGREVDAPDANLWGVTFARDSDRFYATLATGGRTHLIEGSVSRRSARVIHDNVECPSLSPDGTRIGYKKLIGKAAGWRFHVLDLASGHETPLAEKWPVDDQLEWLDDRTVLFNYGEDIWRLPADGTGVPQRFVARADSPAVVH